MEKSRNQVHAVFPESDVPACARRSLLRLPREEHARFLAAWNRLGGGVVALARDGDMALAGTGVCEALLARSWAARHRAPREMLHLADAARQVAEELKPRMHGRLRVADLQSRAWGELANALRVANRVDDAAAAFDQAWSRLQDGSGDPYLKAHLFELQAPWLAATGQLGAAQRRLTVLAEIYHHLGEPHLAGRTRVTQSIYASRSGRQEEALRLSTEGLAQIDRRRDPGLLMTALHNRLLLFVRLGRQAEARTALAKWRGFTAGAGPCAVALRLRWMEGRVCHGLGELTCAEAALRQARDGLAALGLEISAAVASLDLAATLLRQGRTREAQDEARTARTIFLLLELRHELLGVVVFLDEAFRAGKVTAELVERTVALLRRREIEHGPGRAA
jgi:tetratricopeptide (TPR) repeat protein